MALNRGDASEHFYSQAYHSQAVAAASWWEAFCRERSRADRLERLTRRALCAAGGLLCSVVLVIEWVWVR